MIYMCHSKPINAISGIFDFSGIFGTCSGGDITIWKNPELTPILRISLPKITCTSLFFPKSGRLIISGWDDDDIRIFSPNNGKLIKSIQGTNMDKITVITSDKDSDQ